MQALLAAWLACLSFGPSIAASGGIAVKDDSGRDIALSKPATRIVTLSPHATELVFESGAGGAVVGVSEASDFPAAARRLPQVGSAAGIDLEQVLELKPDLVVVWTSGNSRAQIEALERAGMVVFESDPSTVEEIATSLERLGELAGTRVFARQRADAFRDQMASLFTKEAGKASLSVFYQISQRPIFTLGAPHLVSRLFEVCGARNAFQDLSTLAPQVSSEAVIARKPDLIVTDPADLAQTTRDWNALDAVARDGKPHVVGIDADLLTRATPRVAEGTRELCEALDRLRPAKP